MLLTIAIAVYNAEKYIGTLGEKLIRIESRDLQFLFIDDGSKDNSRFKCDELMRRDKRVKVIHKKNGGLANVRNICINKADSEYIWFIDADDDIAVEAIPQIIDKLRMTKSDILLSNVITVDKNKNIGTSLVFDYDNEWIKNASKNEMLSYLWGTLDMTWGVWRHIFNVTFLRENGCLFDTNLKVYEDCNWFIEAVVKANKFDSLNDVIYLYYIDVDTSISHQKIEYNTYLCAYEVCTKWFRFFENHEDFARGRDGIMFKMAHGYTYISGFIGELDINDRRQAIKLYKKNIDIANYYEAHKNMALA